MCGEYTNVHIFPICIFTYFFVVCEMDGDYKFYTHLTFIYYKPEKW